MPYQTINWEDYPSTNTKVTAARLNHMDQGIVDAEAAANTAKNAVNTLSNTVSQNNTAIQQQIREAKNDIEENEDDITTILTKYLTDGYLSFQKRDPGSQKTLNGTLYGNDPFRLSIPEGTGQHYTADKTITLEKGTSAKACSCQGSIGGTATVTINGIATAGVYLLITSGFTVSTGNVYGANIRLLTNRASGGTGTQNVQSASLGSSGNAPATITMGTDSLTIKNGAATRITEFSLIRLM